MAAAREVRLFLASSINEFHDERRELGAFLQSLTALFGDQLRLSYELCDYQSPAADPRGKQAVYDDLIRQSQLFYLLVGKRLGKVSRHEFDVAWESLCETGAPRVLPWFRELAPEELEDSAKDFLRYYREDLDQYSVTFTHIDTVKLNILLELKRGGWDNSLQARDGEIRVRGHALFPTENIPVFAKHRELARLREKEAELAEEMHAARAWEDPREEKLFRLQTDMELEDTRTELHRLEGELLNLCAAVQGDAPTTARGRQARALVEEGRAEEALALLRTGKPENEIKAAEAMLAPGLERVRALIDEDRLRIRLLEAQPVTPAITAELRETYARAAGLAERWQVEPGMVYNYVSFLYYEKDYKTAIPIGERLRSWCERDGAASRDRAALDNLLGVLYNESSDFSKARERYEAALEGIRALALANPAAYEPDLATLCNNLGAHLANTGNPARARQYYDEALEIRRRLAATNPAAYKPDLAGTCNNLGSLLDDTDDPVGARRYYDEALVIYRQLSASHPVAYEPDLAATCNNLGVLLYKTDDPDGARRYYDEALEIRRRLAAAHPVAYEPDLATTCNNLGNLLTDTGDQERARCYYNEALAIHRRLAVAHPQAYEPDVAMTCFNYGLLEVEHGDKSLAKTLFEEAETIWRKSPYTVDRAERAADMKRRCGKENRIAGFFRKRKAGN